MHPSEKRALQAMISGAASMLAQVQAMLGAAVPSSPTTSLQAPRQEKIPESGPSYLSEEEEEDMAKRMEEHRLEMLRDSELRVQNEFSMIARGVQPTPSGPQEGAGSIS